MKWTGLNELREKYLSFFESKGHTRLASAPLVPQGDNSLLLINSGMAPLKKFFTGHEIPPNVRCTSCQKCIRTPDIENVGKTARHGTYFEMLGNFSFGEYFKVEATAWAWEFFTKILEIPVEKLYISVYLEDDEAFDIWTKQVGVAPDHMARFGKADNFWEHGSGPCGPSSEIYYDRGSENGCDSPDCKVGCDCDRYIEVWNLVFTQFDSDGKGTYTKMPKPNIDTGMGLERLACVMQDVKNLFEVDTCQNIMTHICNTANVKYTENERVDVSLRVITDHVRSTVFMVNDGILPSNEGRGYVLRRLIRRAARHGRLLGINKSFLFEVCETVINENKSAYPNLIENSDYIKKVVHTEEDNFAKTIDKGMEMLTAIFDKKSAHEINQVLSGDVAFKLNDTFGFPIDLTMEIVAEKGITIDEARFHELMQEQKQRARAARANSDIAAWSENSMGALPLPKTDFIGYDSLTECSKILGIYVNGNSVNSITEGDSAVVILDKTPFYAESGGQVGDNGNITGKESSLSISDTKKAGGGQYLHMGIVEAGSFSVGDTVDTEVTPKTRLATMRNHSCAHLLQSALRKVLGDHVRQAGSYVNDEHLRFDFNHFNAVTYEEISRIEAIVNEEILAALPITMTEMPIDEARKIGAMALFGEKYGDIVRVVRMSDFSIEFCGGTHLDNTSKIGLFKIISESSVAAGVRRIEAVTGMGVINQLNQIKSNVISASIALKLANPNDLVARCNTVMTDMKSLEKQIETLNNQIAQGQVAGLFEKAVSVNGVNVISAMFNFTSSEVLRNICDRVRERSPNMVAVFAGVSETNSSFVCTCGKDAVAKGAHAGNIVKAVAAITGGKGGGRPDTAMAGIADKFKVDEALLKLPEIVAEFIK